MDRTSFQQFLGLTMGDKVPDAKSIWNFREKITKQNLERKLFDLFRSFLMEKEMIINEGKMVDASIVSVPRQRNKKDENVKIK
jgi:IS5 family transposase